MPFFISTAAAVVVETACVIYRYRLTIVQSILHFWTVNQQNGYVHISSLGIKQLPPASLRGAHAVNFYLGVEYWNVIEAKKIWLAYTEY